MQIIDDAEAVEIEMTIVAVRVDRGSVVTSRGGGSSGHGQRRSRLPRRPTELASGKLDLRVFVDRGSYATVATLSSLP